MRRSGAPLGGAAGVDDPDALVTLQLRHVRVAVDDRGAAGKGRVQTILAACPRARVVHHPDLHALDLDNSALRQDGLQRFVIHVPRDRLHGGESAQLDEHALRDDVPRVQDEIGLRQEPNALPRESAGAARQVRVRDDGDERQRERFVRRGFALRAGLAFAGAVKRNGLLTKTLVRAVFISA
jgi:hypothetical protein